MRNVSSRVPLVIGVKMVSLLFYEPKYLTQYYASYICWKRWFVFGMTNDS